MFRRGIVDLGWLSASFDSRPFGPWLRLRREPVCHVPIYLILSRERSERVEGRTIIPPFIRSQRRNVAAGLRLQGLGGEGGEAPLGDGAAHLGHQVGIVAQVVLG